MKQGTFITAVLLAVGLAAVAQTVADFPGVAVAADSNRNGARASGLNLGITGGPDDDEISISLDGTQTQYVMTSARPINPPSPPCRQVSTFQISCPTSGFVSFSASLGRGDDSFSVGPSIRLPVSMTGGPGRDTLRGASGSDTIIGGRNSDRLFGNNGGDRLRGDKGSDVLRGGKGRDVLNGGKGHDRLLGGQGRDIEKQ